MILLSVTIVMPNILAEVSMRGFGEVVAVVVHCYCFCDNTVVGWGLWSELAALGTGSTGNGDDLPRAFS